MFSLKFLSRSHWEGGVDVRYMNKRKANGMMMLFQCKELELLDGVNQSQRTNRQDRSCKRTV